MGGEIFNTVWPSLDFEARVALLQKEAKRQNAILPEEVARYIAQNLRSNASALRVALIRLITYSSLTGTPITLKHTKRVLSKFIDWQGREGTVDPLLETLLELHGKSQATSLSSNSTAVDCSVVFSLMKTCETQKITRVRQHFEVNMRELERERLADLDVYERESEIRAKKRKRG